MSKAMETQCQTCSFWFLFCLLVGFPSSFLISFPFSHVVLFCLPRLWVAIPAGCLTRAVGILLLWFALFYGPVCRLASFFLSFFFSVIKRIFYLNKISRYIDTDKKNIITWNQASFDWIVSLTIDASTINRLASFFLAFFWAFSFIRSPLVHALVVHLLWKLIYVLFKKKYGYRLVY